MIFNLAKVQAGIDWGYAVPHQPMNMDLVEQIARKAVGHPAIPEDVEDLIRTEWGF